MTAERRGPAASAKCSSTRRAPCSRSTCSRCKIIISGISSVQVLGYYAASNVIRCAWVAEAKTLAFALGERGIHVNTLSLGGTLAPWYRAGLERRAANAGVTFEERLARLIHDGQLLWAGGRSVSA